MTVYGEVKSTKYATGSNGRPTFINIGASYPASNRVTVVIWGESRGNFSSAPERFYSGKTVCVTGELYAYDGAVQMEVTAPSQIQVLD